MAGKKKGYQQSLSANQNSGTGGALVGMTKGARAQKLKSQEFGVVQLCAFDEAYLKMVLDTSSGDGDEDDGTNLVKDTAENLLQTRSLGSLRDKVAALSQKSQGGKNQGQSNKSALNLTCFLYLGH